MQLVSYDPLLARSSEVLPIIHHLYIVTTVKLTILSVNSFLHFFLYAIKETEILS